jgi:hypothetical protein
MYYNVKRAVRIFSPIVTLCVSALRASLGHEHWCAASRRGGPPLICEAYIVCDGFLLSINLGYRRITEREALVGTLQEAVVVVTGASRGLGAAIAEELGRGGAHIVVNY